MVRKTRALPGIFFKPILFNEDDHFNFDKPTNNFTAAISQYASWGYFDPGTNNYRDGYQSPPVHWGINTERKLAFFSLLAQITGAEAPVLERPAAPAAFADDSLMRAAVSALSPRAAATGGGVAAAAPKSNERVTRITYHGWTNSLVLANPSAQVVIVPAIGRVMQFGLLGQAGVLWENRALDGGLPDWNSPEWANFGGDKAWPAPEAQWATFTLRAGWRPPPAFDAMAFDARVEPEGDVTLISAVDPFYHIRVQRRIHLDPTLPVMTIKTTYERTSGSPIRVGIWTITQLADPAGLYAPLPQKARGVGYVLFSKDHPTRVSAKKGLLSLERDKKAGHKIGCESASLLWVGPACSLRIDSPRAADAEYPDQNSSAKIYTNPDPLPYVELEMLGPLQIIQSGGRIEQVNTYTLIPRTEGKPEAEARRILLP
jgi:hypothetical protein